MGDNNKVLPFILLGTALFVMSQSSQQTPTVPNTSPIIPPDIVPDIVPGGQTGGGPVINGVPGIYRNSYPESNWRRAHWATWYKELIQASDLLAATNTIWQAWQNMPYANKITDVQLLAANLLTWRPINNMGIGNFNITASSTPSYDTWTNWYNSVPIWDCEEWKNWFLAMENDWGLPTAKQRFISAWTYTDNWAMGSNAWGCSQDCDFINFFRLKGIDVADFGMETICNLIQVPYNLSSAAAAATQGIAATINTAANMVPIAIVGLTGIFLYSKYKETN